jgi:Protein of unknown function (DUF2752)
MLFVVGAMMTGAGLIALRLFDPATSGVFPPCPVHALTGLYCPGCGSLRALHQLLLGNLGAAFALNPLAVLSLPFLVYGTTSYALFQIRGRYLPRWFLPASWIWTLLAVIILFAMVRNIPAYPFDLLAPRNAAFLAQSAETQTGHLSRTPSAP